MSGGVDSSVVLTILSQLPLDIDVVFMRNWDPLLSEAEPEPEPRALNRQLKTGNDVSSQAHSTSLIHSARGLIDLSYSSSSSSSSRSSSSTMPTVPSPCSWERDWKDVQSVCTHLGIPTDRVRLLDFSKEYWTRVFEPSVAVWEAGGTPNPDVMCNREIKFGALLDAVKLDSDRDTNGQPKRGKRHFLATGHYARIVRPKHDTLNAQDASKPDSEFPMGSATYPQAQLHRAVDRTKDQAYYLSSVCPAQISRVIMPLGGIPKSDVRRIARRFGLPTAERAESMGVCFIGERGNFGDFVAQYTSPSHTGRLISPTGEVLGHHKGPWYFTIGQRARISGMKRAMFVARKGLGEGGSDVLVVAGKDHPLLQTTRIVTEDFAFTADMMSLPQGLVEGGSTRAAVQIRHRMDPVPALFRFERRNDQGQGNASTPSTPSFTLHCEFHVPITGVAPGQVAAVFLGEWCMGSGVIRETVTLGDGQKEDVEA